MIQVNLIGKKRKISKGRNWTLLALMGAFVLFALYFVGTSIFVYAKLTLTNRALSTVDEETVQISREISANNEVLTKFVLSKNILARITQNNKNRFKYKDFLDQIAGILPEGAVLKNVDFTTRGWVAVAVQIQGVSPLRQLESSLKNPTILANTNFTSVFAENVVRDRTGVYNAKLQFEIKPNGR